MMLSPAAEAAKAEAEPATTDTTVNDEEEAEEALSSPLAAKCRYVDGDENASTAATSPSTLPQDAVGESLSADDRPDIDSSDDDSSSWLPMDDYSWLSSSSANGEDYDDEDSTFDLSYDHDVARGSRGLQTPSEEEKDEGTPEVRVDLSFVFDSPRAETGESGRPKRVVRFGKTYVHEHTITVGDRTDIDCPIQLDWGSTSNVAEYDSNNYGHRSYFVSARKLSARQRREWIAEVNGIDTLNVRLLELQELIRHSRNESGKSRPNGKGRLVRGGSSSRWGDAGAKKMNCPPTPPFQRRRAVDRNKDESDRAPTSTSKYASPPEVAKRGLRSSASCRNRKLVLPPLPYQRRTSLDASEGNNSSSGCSSSPSGTDDGGDSPPVFVVSQSTSPSKDAKRFLKNLDAILAMSS